MQYDMMRDGEMSDNRGAVMIPMVSVMFGEERYGMRCEFMCVIRRDRYIDGDLGSRIGQSCQEREAL